MNSIFVIELNICINSVTSIGPSSILLKPIGSELKMMVRAHTTHRLYTITGIMLPNKHALLINFLSLSTNFVKECKEP